MGNIHRRGKKWYIDYRDASGRRIRKVAGTTKRQAARILNELEVRKYYEKANIPVLEKIEVEKLFEQFHSMKELRVLPRTMADWNPRLLFWKTKHLSKSKNFSPLSRFEIEKIIDELSEKLAPKTVNDYVNVLKQVYDYAQDLRLIDENPTAKIKRLQETSRKEPRFFTKEEVGKILLNSNPFYKDLFTFFLYTGMRRDEVRFLEWSDIDFENRIIRVRNKDNFTTKSKRGRNIPMYLRVKEILLKRKNESGFIFESPEGGVFARGTWRRVLLQAAKRAEIKNATLHTFRHTFASWLVMEGIDLTTVAQLLGHTDIKTTMIYSHLAPDHVKKAVEKLPKI